MSESPRPSVFVSGCAFTRFQTLRLRSVFPEVLADQLISYGPCQFPTLGFVVDRVGLGHSLHGGTLFFLFFQCRNCGLLNSCSITSANICIVNTYIHVHISIYILHTNIPLHPSIHPYIHTKRHTLGVFQFSLDLTHVNYMYMYGYFCVCLCHCDIG